MKCPYVDRECLEAECIAWIGFCRLVGKPAYLDGDLMRGKVSYGQVKGNSTESS